MTSNLSKRRIEEITKQSDKSNWRSRLKEMIKQKIESQLIAQTPFIEEMEIDEE
jgi:dsRNA-specific ribonuclease